MKPHARTGRLGSGRNSPCPPSAETIGGAAFYRRFLIAVYTGLCCLLGSPPIEAQGPVSTESTDDTEMASLITLLDEQTDMAAKSGLNADYVPGMVTVLSGDELLLRGARTVWDALSLVPGISLGMEFTGERQVLARGVGHGYASGNIKFLLDDVSMNSTLLATANPVLNMPIEQVERIEVIRGPGSSVYGEFAYAGVVNVVTRRGERALNAQAGEGDQLGAGALWAWRDEERDISLSTNLMATRSKGLDVRVNEDGLYQLGVPELSNAPGFSNEAGRYRGFFLDLSWGDWFASFKWLDDGYGDHFGVNHFLPPRDPRIASWQRYRTLVLGRELAFSETLHASVRLEAMQHNRQRDRLYIYPGTVPGESSLYLDLDYRELKYLGKADVRWQVAPSHELLIGLEASQVAIDKATWDFIGQQVAVAPTWIDTDMDRQILSVFLQDEYRLSDQVTLTGTLRYDDYSDVGDHFSPRIAAVWRVNQENILKLQYAQAFRPPTFYELEYPGRGRIEPSTIDTLEAGYIFKRPTLEARLGLFHSDLSNPIAFDEVTSGGFQNAPDARLQGFEAEYRQSFGAHFKLDANLSYVDAELLSTGQRLPGGADWLANLGMTWQPLSHWTLVLEVQYVGERSRSRLEDREPLDSQTTADLTLSYRTSAPGPYMSLGVKNLSDTDVRFPDQLTTGFQGEYYLAYPDDYTRPGRHWWLSVGYDF
jgi:outer membrane receptor for ferrienterochelin and colicins